MIVTGGSTNVTVPFYFVDDVGGTNPGEPTTGLLFSDIETGGSASYQRQGGARVDFELFTLGSASAGHTPGGFILVDDTEMPGVYRCDIPDAAVAAGVDFVIVYLRAASGKNTITRPLKIDLTLVDLRDNVRGGMTALPSAAAEATGGLYTRGSGAGQINQNANGQIDSNPVAISGDTAAADNLELQYDTTGLSGDTFPATQAQVGNIATGAGGLSALISAFAKVGAEPETNTFTATQQGDGTYHIVEDDGGNTDFYYQATVGAGGKATAFTWKGYVQSNGDSTTVWYWDWVGTAYKQIDTLTGSNGTTPTEEVFLVPVGATGTGADQGKVRLRFLSTTTTAIATDRLLCEFTQASQSVGYANGQVWVDSNSANTNTVSFVDGVADNVVGSWANAITISGQVGLTDFHIINGSTIALSGTSDNFSIFGDNWTLQLESRSVDGAYFQGAHVSGISTAATEVHFEGCDVATASVQKGHFDFCSFSGTVTHTLAGDYNYHNCYSGVAGTGGPTFAKTAGQAITAQWRGWKGSINLTGLQVGDTLTIGGVELGTIDLGSPAGAVVVEIRGIYKDLVNIGSANVNLEGAINAADVATAYAGPRGPGVYLNDAAANTNTLNGFDGTLLNPVSTIAAAKAIADSLGFKRIYLINDSSVTLTATMEDYEFIGIGEMMANTINFGSQDVDNSAFYNLLLTGTQGGTGRCQPVGCVLSVITGMEITASGCVLADAGVLTLRDDCAFDACFSAVAGSGTPTLDINSVASVNVYFRHYSGGLQINNAVATTVMSFEADGQLVVDATCTSLTVVVRGDCSITDNGTTTNLTQDAAINLTNINAEVDTALVDIKLDHLVAVADGDDPVDGSIMAHLVSATEDWSTFVPSTDSLQAIRDGGDAGWITAVGFSTHTAANVWAVGTRILTASTNFNDVSSANVQAACDASLVAINLDHLMKTAVANNANMTIEVTDGSVLSNIMSKTSDTSTFVIATDSLEGIADGGGGDATAANQTTIIDHLTDVKGTAFVKDTDSLIDLAHTGADSDTLETLSDQIDSIVGGTGTGARTVSVTVNDGTNPLENANVRFTEGANTYLGQTDVNGLILFSLDDFTYGLAIAKSDHSFTPTTLVVDGDKTETYSMTVDSITPPPSASTTTGVMTVYDEQGSVEEGVEVTVQIQAGPGTPGIGYDSKVWTKTSSALGVVEFAGIVHGAQYKIWRGDSKPKAQTFTAPSSGVSFDLAEVIGRG